MNLSDDEIQALMMKLVDGVASAEEAERLASVVSESERWQQELRAFRKIKEVTDGMQFKELPDSYWESYWGGVYRRAERSVGWILMSVGAMILLSFGGYLVLSSLYSDPRVSVILKIGVTLGGLGVIVLLVSLLRERLFARKKERYEKEVDL